MTDPSSESSQAISSDAATFAAHAARLLADSRCEDVIVQDLRGLSPVADFFVIASGTSQRQIHSVAVDLKKLAKSEHRSVMGIHGDGGSNWVVGDFIDVIAHLFDPHTRSYYDLESLWSEAPRLDWRSITEPGQFAHLFAPSS